MARRIAFFIHSLSAGGAERVTTTLANYWARKNWQVSIVTVAPQECDFYEVNPSVKRISLDLARPAGTIVGAIVNNARRVIALRRILRDLNPQFVIGMMTSANVTLALASLGLRCITIGSERIHPPQMPLGRGWELLRYGTYCRLNAVVALTHQSANWISTQTSARRIATIANPLTWPMLSQEPIIPVDSVCKPLSKVILAVGRLVPQKQFDHVVNAFSEIAHTYPNWVLVILGEGPERSALQDLAASRGLSGRVAMPGEVGNVADWYSRAAIFVLSSKYEGFPNALAEAMAHGMASVSYDCETGPRDLVRDDSHGLLVQAGMLEALRSALVRLMDDERLRRSIGENAKEVRMRFSVEHIASRWDDLLSELEASARLAHR